MHLYDPAFSFAWLEPIPAACARAFKHENLLAPAPSDSDHKRKDSFNALLAAEDWPRPSCHRLRVHLLPHLEQLVAEAVETWQRKRRQPCSIPLWQIKDLAEEQLLLVIRRAESWLARWRAAGALPGNDFKGFLYTDVSGKLGQLRRVMGREQQMPGPPGTPRDEDEAPFEIADPNGDPPQGRGRRLRLPQPNEQQQEFLCRLAPALRGLDRNMQRCIRLYGAGEGRDRVGLYPLLWGVDKPWDFERIAEHLQITRGSAEDLYWRGLDQLRQRLLCPRIKD